MPQSLAGRVIVLQAFGGGASGAAGVSHSFVELYNLTNQDISLDGVSLFYADGTTVPVGQVNNETADGEWVRLPLSGTIPANGSFLILGPRTSTVARHQIADGYGDINNENFILSNRAFKVVLIMGSPNLGDIQNPFNIDGRPIAGYIDMVGTANEYGMRDRIFGFEYAPARNSASVAVRRIDLYDTDNNAEDFESLDYRVANGMTNELLEVRRPRNSSAGARDPFEAPALPPGAPAVTTGLMILQANTFGNNNNTATGSGFARSAVELFNASNTLIDLTAGSYYLHIGYQSAWTHAIPLEGEIPPGSSFLIVDNTVGEGVNATPRAALPPANQYAAFVLGNNHFKIAVMRNQSNPLTSNPFTTVALFDDYVDMLSVGNATSFETAHAPAQSRPRIPRRISLVDTNNNNADFGDVDTRDSELTNTSTRPSNEVLYRFWPRNSTMGAWNPMTGYPRIDPVPSPHLQQ